MMNSYPSSFARRAVPQRRQCIYCDCELPPQTPATMTHCQNFDCRQAWEKDNLHQVQAREKEAQAQLTYRMEQFRAQQGRVLKTATDNVVAVQVPHNDNQAVTLPQAKRDDFLQHITQLVETLDEQDTEEPIRAKVETPSAPHLEAVLTAGCSTCRGYCCTQGEAYHAFIQRATLKRVLDHNEELTAADLVAHYAQYLPDTSMEGGCVYQTATGCCLPGQMRADICHDYFCEGLHRFVKENRRQAPDYSVIIATDNNEPIDASRVSASGEQTHLDVKDI